MKPKLKYLQACLYWACKLNNELDILKTNETDRGNKEIIDHFSMDNGDIISWMDSSIRSFLEEVTNETID